MNRDILQVLCLTAGLAEKEGNISICLALKNFSKTGDNQEVNAVILGRQF